MKLTVPVQDLLDGLRKVLSVVSSRSTIPILSNVLLTADEGSLSLTTTDLEVSIRTNMTAMVEEQGETTLPAKTLGQIVSSLPNGDVLLQTDENRTTTIDCNRAHFSIMGMNPSEFPRDGDFQEDLQLTLSRTYLGKTLRKISYATSSDQTRYILNGILLSVKEGSFTCVATDGRRLAMVEKSMAGAEPSMDGDAVLPAKAVTELQKLLDGEGDVTVRISDSRAAFEMAETSVTTKLVEGNYPNYRQVIPGSFERSVSIPRESFSEVLNRVSVVLADSGSNLGYSNSAPARARLVKPKSRLMSPTKASP